MKRIRLIPSGSEVVSDFLDAFSVQQHLSIAFRGSVATQTVDELSDIDVLVAHEDESAENLHRLVVDAVHGAGDVITWFPATHLGLENLLIFFVERNAHIVKLDVNLVPLHDVDIGPPTFIVRDPAHRLANVLSKPRSDRAPVDISEYRRRFVGWAWYAYTKLVRGELLEANEALNAMRSEALMPLVHHRANIPPHGYRFVEVRLPKNLLDRLRATIPQGLSRDDLLDALHEIAAMFRSLDNDAKAGNHDSLVKMMSAIDRAEARHRSEEAK